MVIWIHRVGGTVWIRMFDVKCGVLSVSYARHEG